VQAEETAVQTLLDSRSTIPVQSCVEAADADLSDFLPRAIAYYSSGGALQAMPWTVSNPILMFDRTAFAEAGLDPDDPPSTLAEVRDAAQSIVDAGVARAGIALRIEPYVFEFLYAKSGETYVNNGNGRDARATAADLDTDAGLEIWSWWDDMVEDGLAIDTGGQPGNFDHLLAIANGNAAMAFEASGALGTIRAVLESGQYAGVEIGTGPLPALREGGGVPVGDGALWIPAAASLEERGAAWRFIEYLSSPEQQAALAVAGGYVPIRTSATEEPVLVQRWAQDPAFRTAYDQLLSGPTDDATVGSLIGDYQGVRDAVRDALTAMLTEGLTAEEALARAQRDATAAIVDYNERVGA
jgi:sn-glycerol 3-phosphate transport system substrate-binding protein